jgi:hypothetical protein
MAQSNIRAAIENALNMMPGIIATAMIVSSSAGSTTIFTTGAPHNFKTGLSVTVAGHSVQALNVTGVCTVTGANTFTLAALVNGVAIGSTVAGTGGTALPNLTAWEGVNFPTLSRTAYQKVNMLPLPPDNPTFGSNFRRERGIYQVTLYYPIQYGPGPVTARAELIQAAFPRGSSFINGGIVVHIDRTPEIMSPMVFEENISITVRIQYRADIFS